MFLYSGERASVLYCKEKCGSSAQTVVHCCDDHPDYEQLSILITTIHLLNLTCNDVSIHNQRFKRFVHFFKQLYQSDNSITSFCPRLAFAGSRSSVGNSFIYVSNMLTCSKYDIINCKCKK